MLLSLSHYYSSGRLVCKLIYRAIVNAMINNEMFFNVVMVNTPTIERLLPMIIIKGYVLSLTSIIHLLSLNIRIK